MTTAIRVVHPTPDVAKGVEYWQGVEASVDGVLGGFGHVSRIESLGTRTFLLQVLPHLSYCAPASSNESPEVWAESQIAARGGARKSITRALDCGAGVGRVSQHSLLPIFDQVHLVEPVYKFLKEAKKLSTTWKPITTPPQDSPFKARKAVHFHCSTLQDFDPLRPYSSSSSRPNSEDPPIEPTISIKDDDKSEEEADGVGSETGTDEQIRPAGSKAEPVTYDLIWAQWCLQHLSDKDLISFLQRSRKALKPGGVIGIKENVCSEEQDGSERVWFDQEDHSITRSTKAYERVFAQAGLDIVKCQVQNGMPAELFVVKMWALR